MSIDRAKFARAPHVALIIETSLASGREILRGVARYVHENRPWSIYHEPRDLEGAVPAWLGSWQGDGVIVRVQNQSIADAVARTRLPAVDVLGLAHESSLPLVHVDDVAIAETAAAHLLERGFRHLGFCGISGSAWSDNRRNAFEAFVLAEDCTFHDYVLPSRRTKKAWEDEQDSLAEWVAALPKPAGVMVCNDPRGQRLLEACRRSGVFVPEELAVIGVDNDEPICEVSCPPLSSVVAGHMAVGYEAAALLDQLMKGVKAPDEPNYLAPAGIVTRQSTDVLAIDNPEVVRALAFIRTHACDGIEVDDVVAQVAASRSALKRYFSKFVGRTMHDEIVRVRMNRAKQLLATSDLAIPEIADRVGYEHPEYFGVVFRREVGQTPGAYRKQTIDHAI